MNILVPGSIQPGNRLSAEATALLSCKQPDTREGQLGPDKHYKCSLPEMLAFAGQAGKVRACMQSRLGLPP